MSHLRYGWTLADLNAIAKGAAANNHSMAGDFSDAYHAAFTAIVDLLYAASTPPTRHDLAYAGKGAVWRMVREHRQTYGYRDRDGWNGVGSAPRFAAYWAAPPLVESAPWEAPVIERLTLREVWSRLSARDRTVLSALAVFDDYRDAAAALNMPDGSFRTYVSRARHAALALWYDWETPREQTGYNRRRHRVVVQPCGTHAAYNRHRRYREPIDPECAAAALRYERARKNRGRQSESRST